MKTPIVKVELTEDEPTAGGVAGQLVAVVEAMIQTRPVTCACTGGIDLVASSGEAARITSIISN